MSADDHLQPQQLAMFMPVGRLLDSSLLGDGYTHGQLPGPPQPQSVAAKRRVLDWKQDENSRRPDGYFAGGIEEPISVFHGHGSYGHRTEASVIWDGHHRIAHAYTQQGPKTEVPLRHSDDENWR